MHACNYLGLLNFSLAGLPDFAKVKSIGTFSKFTTVLVHPDHVSLKQCDYNLKHDIAADAPYLVVLGMSGHQKLFCQSTLRP